MKKCLLLLLVLVTSCQLVHRVSDSAAELFGEEVVARVGEHKLLRSELANYIPAGVSAEDSLGLARQYIDAWAEDLLFLDVAESRLSKEEKDVSRELEEYRRSLLRYRYEERYVNDRLDTLISDEEVRTWYREHPDKLLLDRPLLKARYMVIPKNSRNLRELRGLMSSDDPADNLAAYNLAETVALRYVDATDTWTDALLLARELGTDETSMMKALKNKFIELPDGEDNLRVAYVHAIVPQGSPAPLEYCEERIREIILSARKHALTESLERDLLNDARNKEKLVIY